MAHEIIRWDDDLPEADRQVLTAIRTTLWNYEPLRATRPVMNVSVQDGLVQFTGRVRTSAIKEIAEFLTARVPSVRAVRNDLIADPEVVRAVADAIAADVELAPSCPIIESRDGVVILVGNVPSEELAQRAVAIATAVPLVAGVTSHLKVVPPLPPPPVVEVSTNGAVPVAAGAEAGDSA